MSTEHTLDLLRHEDLFASVDILTRAAAALAAIDPEMVGEIGQVLNALVDLSQRDMTAAAHPDSHRSQQEAGRPAQQADILSSLFEQYDTGAGSKTLSTTEQDEVIVDVLTGETIKG